LRIDKSVLFLLANAQQRAEMLTTAREAITARVADTNACRSAISMRSPILPPHKVGALCHRIGHAPRLRSAGRAGGYP
jgi:hypothetical protein